MFHDQHGFTPLGGTLIAIAAALLILTLFAIAQPKTTYELVVPSSVGARCPMETHLIRTEVHEDTTTYVCEED